MDTFFRVFREAPTYVALLMGFSIAIAMAECWWWWRAPSRQAKRERKHLWRAIVAAAVFIGAFSFYL